MEFSYDISADSNRGARRDAYVTKLGRSREAISRALAQNDGATGSHPSEQPTVDGIAGFGGF